jgi:hypothetical protein
MSKEQLKELSNRVEEAVAFPLLTYDTSRPRGKPNGGSTASTTSIAQQTVRNVLGWRYRDDDARGFTAALGKAFTLTQVEGHTEAIWNPQSFTLQADLGAVTGAAASILKQAKNAVEQALPLLDGLTALRPDIDVGNAEAIRSLVRSELNTLVDELGQTAGPRVQRTQLFFVQLLGQRETVDPEQVEGYLGQLRDRFGLERRRVNTVNDELNFTNYLILVDYVIGLRRSFQNKAQYFVRGSDTEPFLGTQLVLLSQSLEVILEQVQETYDGMDSVFFGAAERQTTVLALDGQPPITVSELLSWVETFSAIEGRRLIEEGGKDGVVSFRQSANVLAELVKGAATHSAKSANNPTRAFHSKRVAVMLDGLAAQIHAAHGLASQISRRPITPEEREGDEENVPLDVRAPVPTPNTTMTGTWVVEDPRRRGNASRRLMQQELNHALDERGHGNEVERGKDYLLVVRGHGLRNVQLQLLDRFGHEVGVETGTVHYVSEQRAILEISVDPGAALGSRALRYAGIRQAWRAKTNALCVIAAREDGVEAPIEITLERAATVHGGRLGVIELCGEAPDDLQYEVDLPILIERREPRDEQRLLLFVRAEQGAAVGSYPLRVRKPGSESEHFIPQAVVVCPAKRSSRQVAHEHVTVDIRAPEAGEINRGELGPAHESGTDHDDEAGR